MAGQSQSPEGIVAVTSTLPYFITAPFLVLIRPDFAGLTIVPFVVLVDVRQSDHILLVQKPPFRRSTIVLLLISFCSWRVGFITRLPSFMKIFSSESVVISNCPLLLELSITVDATT